MSFAYLTLAVDPHQFRGGIVHTKHIGFLNWLINRDSLPTYALSMPHFLPSFGSHTTFNMRFGQALLPDFHCSQS
jgi:hypothetical protein